MGTRLEQHGPGQPRRNSYGRFRSWYDDSLRAAVHRDGYERYCELGHSARFQRYSVRRWVLHGNSDRHLDMDGSRKHHYCWNGDGRQQRAGYFLLERRNVKVGSEPYFVV